MAGRQRGARPDNPWQRATALGKRLRVSVTAGGNLHGAYWMGEWTHPDVDGLAYRIHLQDFGSWALLIGDRPVATGSMEPDTAEQYLNNARKAEPRRLAAWQMLKYLAEHPEVQ